MDLKILFVEDHSDTRTVLARLLDRFGYDVYTAADCRSASVMLGRVQFDVLLSDIGLPDGDGCDLVSKAKQQQPLTAVALTAYTGERDIQRGMDSGFDHYLTKPVDLFRLRSILNGCMPAA